jgi:carbonic anhydrase
VRALGVDPEQLIANENLGNLEGLISWVGAFNDVHVNVKETVQVIRTSPYLPSIPVHGLVIDINTGKLELVDQAN